MVKVTIYVEGGVDNSPEASTFDNSVVFRENFHRLFSQGVDSQRFDLQIEPIGSIPNDKSSLRKSPKNLVHAVLIDLDGPKEMIAERKRFFDANDANNLFFMIQEMEAWILSQINVLEVHATLIGLKRKNSEKAISEDQLIASKHPEEIAMPSEKLNTLFRKFFSVAKMKNGKTKEKPKSYSKTKDGPRLIGLLHLPELRATFEQADALVKHIQESPLP